VSVTNGQFYWVGVEKAGSFGRPSPHDYVFRRISDQGKIFSGFSTFYDTKEGIVAVKYNDGTVSLSQRSASESHRFICEFPK